MKIAAYLNAHGELTSLHSGGMFRLYQKTSSGWVSERDVAVPFHEGMALGDLVAGLHEAINRLGECRVALLVELRGMLKVLLEERGLRTWKSSGSLSEQLDHVAAQELELAKQPVKHCAVFMPACVGDPQDAHYFVDLVDILSKAPHPASRDVLLPFLQAGPFRLLEIRCDHMPRWFEGAVKTMGLDYSVSEEDAEGIFTIAVNLDTDQVAGRSMATYTACANSSRHHGCSGC